MGVQRTQWYVVLELCIADRVLIAVSTLAYYEVMNLGETILIAV